MRTDLFELTNDGDDEDEVIEALAWLGLTRPCDRRRHRRNV